MSRRRRIGIVTGSRSEYGHLRPLLDALNDRVELFLLVGGSHLSDEFGRSVAEIERDGFQIGARVETLAPGGDGVAIADSIGRAASGFGRELGRLRPDLLVLFGDRHETFAAAGASVPLCMPVAHIGGGENTITVTTDVLFRAAITKLSHLHFVATDGYRDKVVAMGEEPWRVHVVGALAVDAVLGVARIPEQELFAELGLDRSLPVVLVTYHPVTMAPGGAGNEIGILLGALDRFKDVQLVFTYPGADAGYRVIVAAIEAFAAAGANARVVRSLGSARYLSLLRASRAMVGNSSSGIIEAPSVGLPVVNVGSRQDGRTHADNVMDVPCEPDAIAGALRTALDDPGFRLRAQGTRSPFGDGHASKRIAEVLVREPLNRRLIQKETAARAAM